MRWDSEFIEGREFQAPADLTTGPADLLNQDSATGSMLRTPLGEPDLGFSVRCVYDSRPPNGYDFNFSKNNNIVVVSPVKVTVAFVFSVPPGYRAVPREWHVFFDNPPGGPASSVTATLLNNNVPLPNNVGIIIGGTGTGTSPVKSFFIVEEQTTFGMNISMQLPTTTGTFVTYVNVYGNLIPVSEVSLPFTVTNKDPPGTPR